LCCLLLLQNLFRTLAPRRLLRLPLGCFNLAFENEMRASMLDMVFILYGAWRIG
jgi:hypothetical protein